MKYIADLHVHSKYSRATARNLDLENLYVAAQQKGIQLVGTGDFTHPAWFEELAEKLVPAEPGLYALKPEICRHLDESVPPPCRGPVRFILTAEISNIYKKGGQTRKNHNLVLLPNLEKARRLNQKLNGIGNLTADGRPILGLDARHLLEILLEISDEGFLIPAHIWTPWFSLLGSKSGFDTLDECFEDLSGHIFAVETGLSSDGPMNRRISFLDRVALVSNSDAHSPAKLGREANILDTEFSYFALKKALASDDAAQFPGTIEFYPEEGKYHADGHRKCRVRMLPEETMACGGICPVCRKPLTLGVLYRVAELADRKEGGGPARKTRQTSLIPLTDILAQLLKVGPGAKKVQTAYQNLLMKFGSELDILMHRDPQSLDQAGIPLLGEALRRMREGKVILQAGFDGEYGRISVFAPEERETLLGQRHLFGLKKNASAASGAARSERSGAPQPAQEIGSNTPVERAGGAAVLNPQQAQAVAHPAEGALLVIAGPGTGKTRTLICRIAHLIHTGQASPENVLAVTFTNKAAEEMQSRLEAQGIGFPRLPWVGTFHSLCLALIRELAQEEGLPGEPGSEGPNVIDGAQQRYLMADAMGMVKAEGVHIVTSPREMLRMIALAKQHHLGPEQDGNRLFPAGKSGEFGRVYAAYQYLLGIHGFIDYEDLLFQVVRVLEAGPEIRRRYRHRFRFIFVDEYQDLNESQYRIVKALAAPENHLCVIGDPAQSIYGFRGSDVQFFRRFTQDYPQAAVVHLSRNYRSTETILKASYQVVRCGTRPGETKEVYSGIKGPAAIKLLAREDETREAEAIAAIIEEMVGGTGHHALDTGRIRDIYSHQGRAFSEFAILTRTHDQHRVLGSVLARYGIPCAVLGRNQRLGQKGIREILSRLRLWEGAGTFMDLERVARHTRGAPGKKVLQDFKAWCYTHRLKFKEAVARVNRLPVPSLTPAGQLRLCEFLKTVLIPEARLADAAVAEKIRWLGGRNSFLNTPDLDPQIRGTVDFLLQSAEPFGADGAGFLSALALWTDIDLYDPRAEKVSLMTMHAAKGLEFPVVFIAGCEEGLVPFQKSGEPSDIDEERRLFFVAMTRARETLCLSYARKRKVFGNTQVRTISPMVGAIEKHLIELEKEAKEKAKKSAQVQLRLF